LQLTDNSNAVYGHQGGAGGPGIRRSDLKGLRSNAGTDVGMYAEVVNVVMDLWQYVVRFTCVSNKFWDLNEIVWLTPRLFVRVIDQNCIRLIPAAAKLIEWMTS